MQVYIYPRKALSANLGHASTCIWTTETVGFDVTAWRTMQDGTTIPELSRFVPDRAAADKLAKLWSKI